MGEIFSGLSININDLLHLHRYRSRRRRRRMKKGENYCEMGMKFYFYHQSIITKEHKIYLNLSVSKPTLPYRMNSSLSPF